MSINACCTLGAESIFQAHFSTKNSTQGFKDDLHENIPFKGAPTTALSNPTGGDYFRRKTPVVDSVFSILQPVYMQQGCPLRTATSEQALIPLRAWHPVKGLSEV